MKSADLEQLEKMVEETAHPSESILHKSLKNWVAIEYYEQGVSIDKIQFEKKITFTTKDKKFSNTRMDVFIDVDGGLAFYCQIKNGYPWLYKFLENIPILKEHTTKQYVVFPENVEALYPMRWQHYISELSKVDVEVLSAPFSIPIENKQEVQINMTYKALSNLVKLKNRYYPKSTLINFLEGGINNVIQMGGEEIEEFKKVKWD